MANYSIVVDSKNFTPFDINPYIQVLRDLKSARDLMQSRLEKIEELNSQYIMPEGTSYRKTQDDFLNDLMQATESFDRGEEGAMKNLNSLFRRFRREVLPIHRAAEAYNTYADKIVTLGPDAIIGNTSTFDDFYGGLRPKIEYRSIKDILSTSAGVMQGLNNALMSSPDIAGDIAKLYLVLKQQGLDGLQALSTIMKYTPMDKQTAEGASQLTEAIDTLYNNFSNKKFDKEANDKILENIIIGAIRGIEAPKYNLLTDRSYMSDLEKKKEDLAITKLKNSINMEEAEAAVSGYIKQPDGTYKFDPNKIYVPPKSSREPIVTISNRRFGMENIGSDPVEGTLYAVYEILKDGTKSIVQDAAIAESIKRMFTGLGSSADISSINSVISPHSTQSKTPLVPEDGTTSTDIVEDKDDSPFVND